MTKIINFPGTTPAEQTGSEVTPADIFSQLLELPLDGVIAVGMLDTGEMAYGSTYDDGPAILWLIEHYKRVIMEETS